MITIERKLMNVKIKINYFRNEKHPRESKVPLTCYLHSLSPEGLSNSYETLQIDLQKDESELLKEMNKTTRRQVRRGEELELEHIVIENPTDQDLLEFQNFYNDFAKDKKTHSCNFYHMKTMKLLRDTKSLLITYMKDSKNILCYRVYIIDDKVAMNLYSASTFRKIDNPEFKKMMSQANRFLTWTSILWFKKNDYELYDFGSLTNDENIRRFKVGFGGEIIPVYFGYRAGTITGFILLKMRDLKFIVSAIRKIK